MTTKEDLIERIKDWIIHDDTIKSLQKEIMRFILLFFH